MLYIFIPNIYYFHELSYHTVKEKMTQSYACTQSHGVTSQSDYYKSFNKSLKRNKWKESNIDGKNDYWVNFLFKFLCYPFFTIYILLLKIGCLFLIFLCFYSIKLDLIENFLFSVIWLLKGEGYVRWDVIRMCTCVFGMWMTISYLFTFFFKQINKHKKIVGR